MTSVIFEPIAARIEADIVELSQLCEPDQLGWTRQVFGEPYRSSRDLVAAKMRQCGLDVHTDTAGNIIGVLRGKHTGAPALVTGSHTDTVTGGGRFDGIVGVMGALELVRQLRENDITLTRDLIVVDFLGEESNDWGLSCLGSRCLAGELTAADLDRRDGQGLRLGDRYRQFGLDPSAALSSRWLRDIPLHGYVELHIEQGPLLERHDTQIGVVTAIAGIERAMATFVGRPDHAGTRPMNDRKDAMVAAAHAVLSVQRIACGAPKHGVATTTRLANGLASPNVVPGEVRMRAEVRSVDAEWLSLAKQQIVTDIVDEARSEGVDVDFDWTTDNEIVHAAAQIQDLAAASAERSGLSWKAVPSGATHDAVHLAQLCPMGMIFVPSRAGRSHCPDEWTDFSDIAAGVQVLSATIIALDAADTVASA